MAERDLCHDTPYVNMSASSSSTSLADHYYNDEIMDVDPINQENSCSQHLQSSRHIQPAAAALDVDSSCSTTSSIGVDYTCSRDTSSSSSSGVSSTGNGDGSSSNNEGQYVHQAWRLKRPVLQHDPKLTRRQLRRMNRCWTLAEVAKHKYCDDGWIAVEGQVYDITEHIASHPGWDSGCQVTTVLSIIAHLGTDCTQEFRDIHAPYPVAWQQLRVFYIGDLASEDGSRSKESST